MQEYHNNGFLYGILEQKALEKFTKYLNTDGAQVDIFKIKDLTFARWKLEKKYDEHACDVTMWDVSNHDTPGNPYRWFEARFELQKRIDGVCAHLLTATIVFRVEDPEKMRNHKPLEINLDADDVLKSESDSKQRHRDIYTSFLD